MNLKNKTIFGTLWNVTRTFSINTVDFIVYAVIARVLTIEEFALLTFSLLVVEFANMLTSVGVNQNLIQRKDWEVSYFQSVLTFVLMLSFLISVLLASAGYILVDMFYSHEAALVIAAFSLMPVLMSIQSIFSAKLERDFKNKELTLIRTLTSFAFGILTIVLVYFGFGLWAVVISKVSQQAATLVILLLKARLPIRIGLKREHLVEIKHFCLPLFGIALLNFFQNKGSNLLVGGLLGAEKFAFVSIAKKGLDVLSQLTITSVNRMVVPSLSRVNESDKVKVFNDIVYFSSLIITPCFFGLGAVSKEFITVAFGEKYVSSAIYLTITSFAMSGSLMAWYLPNLLVSGGFSSTALKLKTITFVRVTVISLSTIWFGVEIMLLCLTATTYLLLPLQYKVTSKHYDVSLSAIMRICMPSLISSVLMVLSIFCLRVLLADELGVLSTLLLLVVSGMVVYLLAIILFFNESVTRSKNIVNGLRGGKRPIRVDV